MKKIILLAFILTASISWGAMFCPQIKKPVVFDFNRAKNVTNDWFTPLTSHFTWKKKFCGVTSYIHDGLEHQYFLDKKDVPTKSQKAKTEWKKLENSYTLNPENIGISYWWMKLFTIKLFKKTFYTPKTTSYAVIADENYLWWAAYYCGQFDGGLMSEGFDIRSSYMPLEQGIIELIIAEAKEQGVPERVLKKLYLAPYDGCLVKDKNGNNFIFQD